MQESEQFCVVFLDQGNKVLGRKTYAIGSKTRVVLYPRLLFKDALELDATQIVLSHNHPGGDTMFSGADRSLTARVQMIGESLEITLLDHIVVSREG